MQYYAFLLSLLNIINIQQRKNLMQNNMNIYIPMYLCDSKFKLRTSNISYSICLRYQGNFFKNSFLNSFVSSSVALDFILAPSSNTPLLVLIVATVKWQVFILILAWSTETNVVDFNKFRWSFLTNFSLTETSFN